MTGRTTNGRVYDFDRPVSIAPLITFRIVFGLLMFCSTVRFWWQGWVTSVYVLPKFHFTYMGFDWVRPLGAPGMQILYCIMAMAALLITAGLFYRIAAPVFFATFTYVELIDVTTYLNHYYFISLVAFIMIWLPANRNFSLDVRLKPQIRRQLVPAWNIDILRFQMAVVYVFSGLAKLNADWMIEAQPLRMWLPAKTHLPVIGRYLYETWVAYLFAWFGAVYDLLIVFFLVNKKTRPLAYFFVVVFHIATAVFFPVIGMFPYVMIVCGLIFFSARFHEKLLSYLPLYRDQKTPLPEYDQPYRFTNRTTLLWLMCLYIFLQLIIPLRFLLYPGHLFWNEYGYRFSWRVMLMEKSGAAYFTIKDLATRQTLEVNNAEFLTPLQEKMMSTQPDMILKYAHFLARTYKDRGLQKPEVYAEVYVSLNGRRSRPFIDSTVDLAAQPLTWKQYTWVLPYKN